MKRYGRCGMKDNSELKELFHKSNLQSHDNSKLIEKMEKIKAERDRKMKTIKLTVSEIRSLEHYLYSNPCESSCVYPEMNNSRKSCEECKLNMDKNSILEKLGLN